MGLNNPTLTFEEIRKALQIKPISQESISLLPTQRLENYRQSSEERIGVSFYSGQGIFLICLLNTYNHNKVVARINQYQFYITPGFYLGDVSILAASPQVNYTIVITEYGYAN